MKKSALLTLLFLAAPLMAMDEKDSGGKVEKLKIFINEVPGIARVVYDISSKPPATIEWE